jgi:hypothetical protein
MPTKAPPCWACCVQTLAVLPFAAMTDPKDIEKYLGTSAVNEIMRFARNPLEHMRYSPTSADTAAMRVTEMAQSIKSAPQVAAENVQNAIHSHITSLQANLTQDEQLVVYCASGPDIVIIENIGFPNWHIVVLIGKDKDGNASSVICSASEIRLTCKVMKVAAPDKPYRVGFLWPEKSSE